MAISEKVIKRREYGKRWYLKNKEKANQNSRKWHAENKERARAQQKGYYFINRGRQWARNLRVKYGITVEKYEKILSEQSGRCANIQCGSNGSDHKHRLAVDHCHSSGIIRGILCVKCNSSLGFLGEDPSRIRGLADYIEKFK